MPMRQKPGGAQGRERRQRSTPSHSNHVLAMPALTAAHHVLRVTLPTAVTADANWPLLQAAALAAARQRSQSARSPLRPLHTAVDGKDGIQRGAHARILQHPRLLGATARLQQRPKRGRQVVRRGLRAWGSEMRLAQKYLEKVVAPLGHDDVARAVHCDAAWFFQLAILASMTKMLETKKAEAQKRPLSMAAAVAAAKAARNAKALAADSQLQEEPSSSSLGSTQMGLSADTVKDGSQTDQFLPLLTTRKDEVMWRVLPTPLRGMLADDGIVMLSALPREGPACRVEVEKLLSLQPAVVLTGSLATGQGDVLESGRPTARTSAAGPSSVRPHGGAARADQA